MRTTRYRRETMQLYDFRGVEEHLADMAADGWRLEKAGRYFWKYRRAEPKTVRYAVTYSLDASEFNPGPTDGQEVLQDLCSAAGWQKVSDWNQMQIFSTEEENPVPLETDEALRVKIIDQVMWKAQLPLLALSMVIGGFMCLGPIMELIGNPVRYFESWTNSVILVSWLLILFFYGSNALLYRRWHRKSLESIACGGPCAAAGPYRALGRVFSVLMLFNLAYMLTQVMRSGTSAITVVFTLAYMVVYVLVVAVLEQARRFMRKRQVSRGKNIVGVSVLGIFLFCVLNFLLIFGLMGSLRTSREAEEVPFPLTLEDLTGVPYEDVQLDHISLSPGSSLMTRTAYYVSGARTTPDGETIQETLRYEIIDVKTEWLYQKTLEDRLEDKEYSTMGTMTWEPSDAAPWGAEQVYRLHYSHGKSNSYLLCFPGRLVELNFTKPHAPLTPEGMAEAGRALKPQT